MSATKAKDSGKRLAEVYFRNLAPRFAGIHDGRQEIAEDRRMG